MTAERFVRLGLGAVLLSVFFVPDAPLAVALTLAGLAVAWIAGLGAGLWSPGAVGVGLTTVTLAWLAVVTMLAPAGAHWPALGWAAVGLTTPVLVLRAARDTRVAATLLLALVTASLVVLIQAVAWSSGPGEARLFVYAPTLQWSGYPELGLLACIAGGAFTGLAVENGPARRRILCTLLAIAFAAATVPLGSRSGQVTAVLVVIAVVAARLLRHLPLARVAAAAIAVLIVSLALLLGTDAGERAATRIFDVNAAWSVTLRQRTWTHALEAIAARPWLGFGLGGYAGASPGELAHNFWLHTTAESGVIGSALLTLVWARGAWLALAASPTVPAALGLAVHGALVAFVLRGLTDHFLAAATPGYWRIWVMEGLWLGLAEACHAAARDASGARIEHDRASPGATR